MSPKIGLLVRCDDRGLGNQTWEVYRHLPHDKVLVLRDPGSEKQGFPPHMDRFPGAPMTRFGRDHGGLDRKVCMEFLDGLDVVYSAETYYDWDFCNWAREAGVATVLHTNPEFYFHWNEPEVPAPSTWWSATDWRSGNMPSNTRIVPMPIPIDRWDEPDFDRNPRKVLHVAGLAAIMDRNGTNLVRKAARSAPDIEFEITTQGQVKADSAKHNEKHYWDLYDSDAPIMLIPRRFGGLCLPALEALGAGKLVAMTDTSPNRTWPILPLACSQEGRKLSCQGGDVSLFQCEVGSMIRDLRRMFDEPETLVKARRDSYAWAQRHSWDALTGLWLDELELAVESFLDSPYRGVKRG